MRRSGMQVMIPCASTHSSVDLRKVWRIIKPWIWEDRRLTMRIFQVRLFLRQILRVWGKVFLRQMFLAWLQETSWLPGLIGSSSSSDVPHFHDENSDDDSSDLSGSSSGSDV